MQFRYYGIAELAIVVSNLERAKTFYVGLLGFELSEHDVGERACILRIGENRFLGLWEPGVWKSDFLAPERSASYFGNEVAPSHPVFAVHQDDVEPQNGTASWPPDGRLTSWCIIQGHFAIRVGVMRWRILACRRK